MPMHNAARPAPMPLSAAIDLGRAARDADAERVSRFEVRALVDEVADALRSDDGGERNYHLCRAGATALTLWASTRGLAGGRRVGDLAVKLQGELDAVARLNGAPGTDPADGLKVAA